MFDRVGDRFEVRSDAAKIAAFLDPRTKGTWWAGKDEWAAFRALLVQIIKMATYEAGQKPASTANAPGGGGSEGAALGSSGGVAEEAGVSSRKEDNVESDYSFLFGEMLTKAELTRNLEESLKDALSGEDSDDAAAARVSLAEFK